MSRFFVSIFLGISASYVYAAPPSPPPVIGPVGIAKTPSSPALWRDVSCYERPEVQTTYGMLMAEPPTKEERDIVDSQIHLCRRSTGVVYNPFLGRGPDPYDVLALYRLEADLGIPEEDREILGAAWCWESAFKRQPRAGDVGRSHGPFQMMSVWWRRCGLDMHDPNVIYDPLIAATCYYSGIDMFLHDGKCPGNVARAEAMAANGPKYAPQGCKAKSLHYKELERWRKIRKKRRRK